MTVTGFNLENVGVSIDRTPILSGLTLEIKSGEFTSIVGVNGSGKTTLLRLLYRALNCDSGKIELGGEELTQIRPKTFARQVAVVAQDSETEFDFTVEEVVSVGRVPHSSNIIGYSRMDREKVRESLGQVGMLNFLDRKFSTLSGGEKKRVQIARALAQEPQVLLLDEPTNHLDIKQQFEILSLVKSLGITVVAVLHDLNLVAKYSNKVILINDTKLQQIGTPEAVLTRRDILRFFGVHIENLKLSSEGDFRIIFLRSASDEEMASREGAANEGFRY
jgi:iron complex transport system ATP-binding protein